MKMVIVVLVCFLDIFLFNACNTQKAMIKFSNSALATKGAVNLPEDFRRRTFLKGLVGEVNKPTELPGRLIKIESKDDSIPNSLNVYRIPRLFSKEEFAPSLEILKDADLVKMKITNNSGASTSVKAILDLEIQTNQSFEIFLSDILLSVMADSQIDKEAIATYYQKYINPAEVHNYYFVSNVKVSRYSYQKYTEIQAGTSINAGSVMALEGKLYNSQENLFRDYFLSASLVPLTELLPQDIEPPVLPPDDKSILKIDISSKDIYQILKLVSISR